MDDANMPNLLAIPYMGYESSCAYNGSDAAALYANTRVSRHGERERQRETCVAPRQPRK